ncbi:DNA-3-methyladenine glycosylase family protein [Halorubellus salinus]|uniref:DNA-3-methyladenine glycosylase family protein n=1 Tax=Halorubellus salinus TaxID=755309 RepID=UPI001D06A743|nr:DNA glycosylase [Halorubellus salinus]
MHSGRFPLADLAGGLDLAATLESGQSYLWRREDDGAYAGDVTTDRDLDDAPWYYAVPDGEVVRVRRTDDALVWESTEDAHDRLVHLLRLDDDLDAIFADAPALDLVDGARDAFPGLRLVRDPPFGCLISFICSTQMRVERIHEMVSSLARAYGDAVSFQGETYHAFPTPEQLAATTEGDLRDLGLGYRAPYVQRTAEMVADGDAHPEDAVGREYEAAREYLTRFVGVGDKVADCILLFSLGYLEAIPLDTWMQTVVADHYPDCERGNYTETSRALRERFGGEYAGYVQTYVFHHLRTAE